LIDEVAGHYVSRAHAEAGAVKRKAADLLGFEHYQTYDNWYRKHVEKGRACLRSQ
jgi:hypothetical protein